MVIDAGRVRAPGPQVHRGAPGAPDNIFRGSVRGRSLLTKNQGCPEGRVWGGEAPTQEKEDPPQENKEYDV